MVMTKATEHGHVHGEAFMLMRYECKCGHCEIIWNSRDGVTPFCLGCPGCGDITLQHTRWNLDVYAPNHELHHEQRFFCDGTPDEAEAIMRKRLDMMREQYPLQPEEEEQLIQSCRDGKEGEFQKGWPMIRRYSGEG